MNIEQAAALNPKEFCRDCHTLTTWEECANCYKPICIPCGVMCANGCTDDRLCSACALRLGYEKRGEYWYCENCPEEL